MSAPILRGVIDFHAHLLPWMDHGSRDLAEAVAQYGMLNAHGLSAVVATPHFYAQVEPSVDDFVSRRDAAAAALGEAVTVGPALYLGAEVLLFRGIEHMEGLDRLCIKGTNTILLELPLGGIDRAEVETVEKIAALGLRPVIAHIDRYPADTLSLLDESGAAQYQINAGGFLGLARRSAAFRRMAMEGRVAAIGSDLHGTDRRALRALDRALARLGNAAEQIADASRALLSEQRNKKRIASASCNPGANGFRAEIFVLRPEGVLTYVERAKTEIASLLAVMPKSAALAYSVMR